MSDDSLRAVEPGTNITVQASAGTGKTWLLVSRLLRLLLGGAEPGGILAVTFTRKAAAEMQQRLTERLAELAVCDNNTLDTRLAQMGLPADAHNRRRARRLYDTLMFGAVIPRTTTFHAFCQEILERFPIEAEVPPGFELLENEAPLRDMAWASLHAEATAQPDSAVAQALEALYTQCHSLHNTLLAVNRFLAQRIDWWAFTRGKDHPARWAAAVLKQQLDIEPDQDPLADFFQARQQQAIAEFSDLLGKHPTRTNQRHLSELETARDETRQLPERHAALRQVFLTQDGERRKRDISKTLISKLGPHGAERLIELHAQFCADLETLRERLNRLKLYQLNRHWYLAGEALLGHFQRIKQEQRLLDFTDLEWRSYRLLNQSELAHWIQYKLDQRIDHLLVDEFQDTNPTQWRLLLPLLEELSAGLPERPRSVFLVGDSKQSIYRFRRADARLFGHAAVWLQERLQAEQISMDHSRRSSQAVIDCVNQVFQHPQLQQLIPDFPPHATYHTDLWGEVCLLPLVSAPPGPAEDKPDDSLRNPLQEPRRQDQDSRFYLEGRQLAEQIRCLIARPTLIGAGADARPLSYGDILLLLRNRTHAAHYERALREAGIPYLGTARGTLLQSLEARDLEALLDTLITPFNNLSLAQVLRCPLFACSDDALMLLASGTGGDWMERLQRLAPTLSVTHPLYQAGRLLGEWRQWARLLPVHDLLDRIYFEGDLLRRYLAATPPNLRPRVQANLLRFLELALEIDSGRYPSLTRFLNHLRSLREQQQDAPDDGTPEQTGDRVTIMTIHGAKGLEAPVVMVADSTTLPTDKSSWSPLVDWPAQRDRPDYFVLLPDSSQRDSLSQARKSGQDLAAAREDANLLYVALTRARQVLIISGSEPVRSKHLGWYGLIREALTEDCHSTGHRPAAAAPTGIPPAPPAEPHPALNQPLKIPYRLRRIAPSRQLDPVEPEHPQDPDACTRGIVIHRFLELLATPDPVPLAVARTRVALETGLGPEDAQLGLWCQEAVRNLEDPKLAPIFSDTGDHQSFKEVPLSYLQGDTLIDGVIDRLLVGRETLTLVDFKTSPVDSPAEAERRAGHYRAQLKLYADGVQRLWPDHSLQLYLLFTAGPYLVPVTV